jgi:hypothetical protein
MAGNALNDTIIGVALTDASTTPSTSLLLPIVDVSLVVKTGWLLVLMYCDNAVPVIVVKNPVRLIKILTIVYDMKTVSGEHQPI